MKHPELLALAALLVAGCDKTCAQASADLHLVDANNYDFVGTLEVRSTPLAPGDFSFAWGGLTQDLQGHDLDPVEDIDNASMVVFRYLDQQQVLEGLATNTLEQKDVGLYVGAEPEEATQLSLSDLSFMGTDVDVEQYFTPEYCVSDGYCTWMLSLTTGTTPGVGTRVAAFVEPSQEATDTHLEITDESSKVVVDADLQSLEVLPVPTRTAALQVDWSAVTTTGQGVDMAAAKIDQLMLASYDLSLDEVEADFLDIETLAAELWTMDLTGGESADLSQLQGFTGVDTEHTWILALRCTTCANPAPPVLTVLTGCE